MLVREGAEPWTSGRFYVTVVKYIQMFGSYKWVVTTHIIRTMGSLHNWAAHLIFIRMSHQLWNRVRNYLPIGISMEDAGM